MSDFCTSQNGVQRIVSDVAVDAATSDAAFAPDQTLDEINRAISNGATGIVAPVIVGALNGTALSETEAQAKLTRLIELPELESFEIKADSNGHNLHSHDLEGHAEMLPDARHLGLPVDAAALAEGQEGVEVTPLDLSAALLGYPDAPGGPPHSVLLPQHVARLKGISPQVLAQRGYRTALTITDLVNAGYSKGIAAKVVPALVIPIHDVLGQVATHQIRPDNPRLKAPKKGTEGKGKPIKYETPSGTRMVVDVPPSVLPHIGNPNVPLYITEGPIKADHAASCGLACVALLGIYNWCGTNGDEGKTALAAWKWFAFKHKDGTPRLVYIAFDSDVIRKREVQQQCKLFKRFLEECGAKVHIVVFREGPNGEKVGFDDYFNNGGTPEGLAELVQDDVPKLAEAVASEELPVPRLTPDQIRATFKEGAAKISSPRTLEEVKRVYRKWIYMEDDALLEVCLGTVAANLMDGDPVWLMIVGPSGGGKTEIINPLVRLPFFHMAATLTAPALLSGSSKRDMAASAKGGLLREVGSYGFLLLKDFTSILSMHRDARTEVLGALREIYDGSWTRHVGSDGGRELHWQGKMPIIACCTEVIDEHHAVVGSMGERFAFYRLPPINEKALARHVALRTGREPQMRREIEEAVAGLFAGVDIAPEPPPLSEEELLRLMALSRLAAHCRSGVIRDGYSRDINLIPESERPTRILAILQRIFGGMVTIGVPRERAWQVLRSIALDSMHKVRRIVLDFIVRFGGGPFSTTLIATVINHPTSTTRRALEDLTAHNVLVRSKADPDKSDRDKSDSDQSASDSDAKKAASNEPGDGKKGKGRPADMWELGDWGRDVFPTLGLAHDFFTYNGWDYNEDGELISNIRSRAKPKEAMPRPKPLPDLSGTKPPKKCDPDPAPAEGEKPESKNGRPPGPASASSRRTRV